MREELGLGTMYPSERAAQEMRVLMDRTGFTARLAAIGAASREAAAVTRSDPAVRTSGRQG